MFHDEYDRAQTGRDRPRPEEEEYLRHLEEERFLPVTFRYGNLAEYERALYGEGGDDEDGEA